MPPGAGGGGDDRGRGPDSPSPAARLRRARLGLAVALTPIIMLFVSFTSAYVVRKGLPTLDPKTNAMVHDWFPVELPMTLFLINTGVLLVSSVTIEMARRRLNRQAVLENIDSIPGVSLGKESKIPWLGLTILLGCGFLTGQWLAWRNLADHGIFVATAPSSSFIYLLTGAHAAHLLGGVIALLAAGAFALLHHPLQSQRIWVDVTAWYWHFMAVLWIYILALLAFAH